MTRPNKTANKTETDNQTIDDNQIIEELNSELTTEALLKDANVDNDDTDTDAKTLGDKGKLALQRERENAKKLAKKLAEYEKLYKSMSPDDLQQLIEEKKRADEEKLLKENKFKEYSAKLKNEKDQLAKQVEELREQQEKTRRRTEIMQLFYKFGGKEGKSALTNRTNFDAFYEAIKHRLDWNEDGLVVLTADGKHEDMENSGAQKTIDALIEEFRADEVYGKFFEKTEPYGTGIGRGTSRSRGKATFDDWAAGRGLQGLKTNRGA